MLLNSVPRQIDVSLAIHSYNIILVVDISLSMIGYNGSNRINPLKNRWPAIERGIIKIANQLEWRDRLTYLAFHAKVYEIMNGESADDAIDTTFEILLRNIFAGLFIGDTNRNVKM